MLNVNVNELNNSFNNTKKPVTNKILKILND